MRKSPRFFVDGGLRGECRGRRAGRGGVLPKHWPQSGMNCRSRVGRRMSGTSRLSLRRRPCGGKRLRMPCGSADRNIPQKRSVPAKVRSFSAILRRQDYFIACSTATATATVAPTIGLLPMPRKPIISTCAGTDDEPANWASECIRPIVSVIP